MTDGPVAMLSIRTPCDSGDCFCNTYADDLSGRILGQVQQWKHCIINASNRLKALAFTQALDARTVGCFTQIFSM